ncbi:hypothetical protein BJ878DRAFT_270761 [Calycina marina]|uniref:Uncharacterized protein n=1 Tax=Calycina marina TaxID=1763456 RepID=A0A9P7YVJ9_9HELO|nr:hypothetical protein BJ878DRAFT_270761 [Calycina marina]
MVNRYRAARKGLVHNYTNRLTAFEHTPKPDSSSAQNLLIFIGGLFDGLQTVPYTDIISNALPETWSLAQVHLSSSYTGFGTSSLLRDATELAKCVTYFRTIKTGKIILMGHSTGCQDVMEYLTGPGHKKHPAIDGGIIQAPASDREAIVMTMDPSQYLHSVAVATKMVEDGGVEEIVPRVEINGVMPAPVCARRWLSLASPYHDGDDDYFSSDLKDEQLMKTFGALPKGSPICVIFSGEDEYIPKTVDKQGQIKRWAEVAKNGEGRVDEESSGVVDGASHNLAGNPEAVVNDLVKRVLLFLYSLSKDARGLEALLN